MKSNLSCETDWLTKAHCPEFTSNEARMNDLTELAGVEDVSLID